MAYSWLVEEDASEGTILDKAMRFVKAHKPELAALPANEAPKSAARRATRGENLMQFVRRTFNMPVGMAAVKSKWALMSEEKIMQESGGIGKLFFIAERVVHDWEEIADSYVKRVRKAETRSAAHMYTLLQRSSGEMVLATLDKHATLSIFFSTTAICIQRWQLAYLVVSSLLVLCMVDVWLFWCASCGCRPCCQSGRALMPD